MQRVASLAAGSGVQRRLPASGLSADSEQKESTSCSLFVMMRNCFVRAAL